MGIYKISKQTRKRKELVNINDFLIYLIFFIFEGEKNVQNI